MANSSCIAVPPGGPSPAPLSALSGQLESPEYRGFGGYNRTAMACVSRSTEHAVDADTGRNADDLPVLSASNEETVALITKRTRRTWDGVFLPVSISIFGVVLFFRLPWIVGECGLWLTLVGILVCFFVTLLTTCSLAAISTNGHVGDGGAYMMVSRCLGPQVGVAVGITLVLANTLASAMYLVGGVDVIINMLGNPTLLLWLKAQTYGVTVVSSSLMLLFLFVVSLLKLDKIFRVVCFLLTFSALLNFVISAFVNTTPLPSEGYTGVSGRTLRHNWSPDFSEGTGYQEALYVLFPGVCGLMSGVSSSGELRNGSMAIPKGIMYAWFLTLATYLVTAVVVAASFDRRYLKTDYHIMERAAFFPLFIPGAFCASFAAVLSGVVGSSHVLSAIAADGILPFRFFEWIARCRPQVSVMILYACVQVIILCGNGYALFSVFATEIFLVTFLALNVSVFLSSAFSIASFRPTFSFFNTLTAFTGALAALMLMFCISPLMAFCVLLFMLAVLVLVDLYFDPSKVYWGDASQPLLFHFVRKFLLRLDERKTHVRHWRPSILHVVTDPLCSLNLIHLANNLKKGGLYEVCLVLRGDFHSTTRAVFRWKGWLMDFIEAGGVKAFPLVTSAEDLHQAVQGMLHLSGLGSMRPNTILLSMDEILQREHFQWIYSTYRSSESVVQTRVDEGEKTGVRGRGEEHAGGANDVPRQSFHNLISNTITGTSHIKTSEASLHVPHPHVGSVHSDHMTVSFLDLGTSSSAEPPVWVGSFVTMTSPEKDRSRNMEKSINEYEERLSSPSKMEGGAVAPSPYMLPADLHTLKDVCARHNGELQDDLKQTLPMDARWSEWLRKSMWGGEPMTKISSSRRETDSSSPVESNCTKELVKAASSAATETQWPKSTHAYRTKRSFHWGLFRSGRGDAEEDVEGRLVEQMVAHRHSAQLAGEVDLAGYRDKKEFCCIARDAASAFMNVVIARNMDLLDTDAIEKSGKERKWFIDVWLPDESDATLYLMAHCFRLTSVWKKYAVVRVVSVVRVNEKVPQKMCEILETLKSHRLFVYPRVVTLEDEMVRSKVSDIATMERRFEDPKTRPAVMNSLVRAEVERTGRRIAMVMMRVPPFAPTTSATTEQQQERDGNDDGDDKREENRTKGKNDRLAEEADVWFESLREMTSGLPPCLLLAGGRLHCRSTDW